MTLGPQKHAHAWDIFVSYSTLDARRVVGIAEQLRSNNLHVWLDRWCIPPGAVISQELITGHASAHSLVAFITENWLRSEWTQWEWLVRQFSAPLNTTRRFIPVLLEDCELPPALCVYKYIDLRNCGPAQTGELIQACQRNSRQDRSTAWSLAPNEDPDELVRNLTIAILWDRADNGLWGNSLAESARTYNRGAGDPGSITVTQRVLQALEKAFPYDRLPENKIVLKFLLERYHEGKVGLEHAFVSGLSRSYAVLHHYRHTAVAAVIFRDSNALTEALRCITFLTSSPNESGGWPDLIGSSNPADPLTTAFVLRSLIDFDNEGLLASIESQLPVRFAESFRARGMLWLIKALQEMNGWWPYRPEESRRFAYWHTSFVLNALPKLATEPSCRSEQERLMNDLGTLWRQNGLGIPAGPDSIGPDVNTTSQYAITCWRLRHRYPNLAAEFESMYLHNLPEILSLPSANCVGWAFGLRLLIETGIAQPQASEQLREIRSLARQLGAKFENTEQLKTRDPHPAWIHMAFSKSRLII